MAEALTPLRGVRVLDLSRYLPGPFLTRVLADLGADVIKLESPEGDPTRHLPPHVGGVGVVFAALNWGKRSVVVNMKSPLGVEVVRAIAARVDVLVESFRPGVLERLGLAPDALLAANPRLVLCSISGYGQDGPMRDIAGHDLNYVARAGALGLFGPQEGPPTVPAVQIADLAGGALTAAVGVLATLLEREKTGRGRHLDVSMTRGVHQLLTMELARRAAGDAEAAGVGLLTGGLPCYRTYRTRDGRAMSLGALEPKFFLAFCDAVGRPELAAYGLALGEAGAETMAELERIFAEHTQAEWVQRLAGVECCCEPVVTPEAALHDPGVGAHRVDADGVLTLKTDVGVRPEPPIDTRIPALGADGRAVVEELGIDADLVRRAGDEGSLWPGGAA